MKLKARNAMYLLPNAFTIAALFFGFYAINKVFSGDIEQACIAIVISAILDTCDGLVARLTKTESKFGIELDSLSDAVAFGAAPAVILFQHILQDFEKFGFIISFMFCAAVCMRLARFSVAAASGLDKRYFIGLPCPAGALIIVSYIASAHQLQIALPLTITAILTISIALTMISGLRYPSLKAFNFKNRMPFRFGLLIVLLLALGHLLSDYYMPAIFIILFSYLLYGYFAYITAYLKSKSP